MDEIEVYVTRSGLGRAAIVRRSDGLFCVYIHRKLPAGYLPLHFAAREVVSWANDTTPHDELYKDVDPEDSLFGTVADARRWIRGMTGFEDASLVLSNS